MRMLPSLALEDDVKLDLTWHGDMTRVKTIVIALTCPHYSMCNCYPNPQKIEDGDNALWKKVHHQHEEK